MNNKQAKIAATTAVGTLGAEALVGGLGIGLLGTAVAVPAAAVVATVGTIAFFAASDDVRKPVSKVTPKVYSITKGNVTYRFTPDPSTNTGKSYFVIKGKPFALGHTEYTTIQEMRDYYKNLLTLGFKSA